MSVEQYPLLSCPFCASVDLMVLSYRISMTEVEYEVTCKRCGAGAGYVDTVELACEKWNARKPSAELSDLTAALPLSAIVYGMMHRIPGEKLLAEIERRGGA